MDKVAKKESYWAKISLGKNVKCMKMFVYTSHLLSISGLSVPGPYHIVINLKYVLHSPESIVEYQ